MTWIKLHTDDPQNIKDRCKKNSHLKFAPACQNCSYVWRCFFQFAAVHITQHDATVHSLHLPLLTDANWLSILTLFISATSITAPRAHSIITTLCFMLLHVPASMAHWYLLCFKARTAVTMLVPYVRCFHVYVLWKWSANKRYGQLTSFSKKATDWDVT